MPFLPKVAMTSLAVTAGLACKRLRTSSDLLTSGFCFCLAMSLFLRRRSCLIPMNFLCKQGVSVQNWRTNMRILSLVFLVFVVPGVAFSQEKPIVGLIPKAQKPIKMDGKLDDWDGAFVTPVHVGHPDFANRGGEFLFLWDDQNLYIGLRCLDQKPAHVGKDNEIYNGDAVEFYLDTRRGDKFGAAQYGPGSLHMFWTPF